MSFHEVKAGFEGIKFAWEHGPGAVVGGISGIVFFALVIFPWWDPRPILFTGVKAQFTPQQFEAGLFLLLVCFGIGSLLGYFAWGKVRPWFEQQQWFRDTFGTGTPR